MQDNKKTELSISTDVLEKMAELAAGEVAGVAGICKKAIDLKGAVKSKNALKGVKVEAVNGAIEITIYLCVEKDARVRDVAEQVQLNVKDKIQTMTATAVTKVNVVVADVKVVAEQPQEEASEE